eukprot:11197944-Lingulodinium_polyedra.AAC.1
MASRDHRTQTNTNTDAQRPRHPHVLNNACATQGARAPPRDGVAAVTGRRLATLDGSAQTGP